MPVCYKFVDKETGETVDLNKVDREMCEDSDAPYNDKHYCPWFQLITDIGCSSKVQNEKGVVDRDKLLALLNSKTGKEEIPQKDKDMVVKYLCDKYDFSAWYQRHH
jgi:hypothetical protein